MNYAIAGGDMEDKVRVSIEEINNGYVFHRSWCEGKGNKMKYYSEEYFMKELPSGLEGLFQKGSMKKNGDVWSELSGKPLKDDSEDMMIED